MAKNKENKREQGDDPSRWQAYQYTRYITVIKLLWALSLCQKQTKGLCITSGLFWGLKCDFIGTQAHFHLPQRMIFSHVRIFKITFIQLWWLHWLLFPLNKMAHWNSSGYIYWNACKLCTYIYTLTDMAEVSIKKTFTFLLQHLSVDSKCQYYPQWEEKGGWKVGSFRKLIAIRKLELWTRHAFCSSEAQEHCNFRSSCTTQNLQRHALYYYDHHRKWIHVNEKVHQ